MTIILEEFTLTDATNQIYSISLDKILENSEVELTGKIYAKARVTDILEFNGNYAPSAFISTSFTIE